MFSRLINQLFIIRYQQMKIVEERGGQPKVLPVTDEVLSGLQRMADTFYELKIILKKIDIKDKNYNWFPQGK